MSANSRNGARAGYLAQVVARRDGATLRELVASLRQLKFDDASAIIELAEAQLIFEDRIWWEGYINAVIANYGSVGNAAEADAALLTCCCNCSTKGDDEATWLKWSAKEEESAWTSFDFGSSNGSAAVLKRGEDYFVTAITEFAPSDSMAEAQLRFSRWLRRASTNANMQFGCEQPVKRV